MRALGFEVSSCFLLHTSSLEWRRLTLTEEEIPQSSGKEKERKKKWKYLNLGFPSVLKLTQRHLLFVMLIVEVWDLTETLQETLMVLYCDVENHLLEIDKVEKFEFIKSKFMKSNYNRSNFHYVELE